MAALDPLTAIANTVSSGLNFAGGIVLNSREKNAAAFTLESQRIANDAAIAQGERDRQLLVLKNQFNNEQARIDEEERADQLKIIAIVGLFATLIIVIVIAFKSRN